MVVVEEIDGVGNESRVVYFWAKEEILELDALDREKSQERSVLWQQIKDINTWL